MDGVTLSSFEQISDEAVDFFQKLLGEEDANVVGCSVDVLNELVSPISVEVANSLCA